MIALYIQDGDSFQHALSGLEDYFVEVQTQDGREADGYVSVGDEYLVLRPTLDTAAPRGRERDLIAYDNLESITVP